MPPPYTEHQKLFTPDSWSRLSAALDQTATAGTPCERELQTGRIDGSSGWLWVYGKTVRDAGGVVVGLKGAAQEITERRRLEEQLRQAGEMTVIGEFAGGIAHDFNNQLSGIPGYADMLEGRLKDERLRRFATNIKTCGKRAAELTAPLLAFSRKGKNLSVPVSIHKLIAEVSDILEHSLDKRIKIQQQRKARSSTTTGDPNQLQNALLNIALKARVLFVDDEELVRTMTTDMLSGLGYTVTACKDGKEALACYQRSWKETDLVILDMIMLEMGGRIPLLQ